MDFTKYEELKDEELIIRFQQGETDICDYLMEKYKNLVRKKAKTMYLIGGDHDDLMQEGMIGLFRAVRDYRSDKDSSFYNFADLCITRQLYSAIQASRRQKHIPLNSYVSLYAGNEQEQAYSLLDSMESTKDKNPEELVLDRERMDMIEYELERCLSRFEKQVVSCYLEGMSYAQIAQKLDKSPKSIDNALQRVKNKMNLAFAGHKE